MRGTVFRKHPSFFPSLYALSSLPPVPELERRFVDPAGGWTEFVNTIDTIIETSVVKYLLFTSSLSVYQLVPGVSLIRQCDFFFF